MLSILERFISFERFMGPTLVRILYYVAAAGIVVVTAAGMVMGLLAIFAGNVGGGAMQVLAYPAVGAVALVYWRFLCELFMLAFLTYERLGEVRDRLAPPPDPNHPQF
jgi:hypothetical protein